MCRINDLIYQDQHVACTLCSLASLEISNIIQKRNYSAYKSIICVLSFLSNNNLEEYFICYVKLSNLEYKRKFQNLLQFRPFEYTEPYITRTKNIWHHSFLLIDFTFDCKGMIYPTRNFRFVST